MNAIALILAAGKGTRMRSELPKPLVPFHGIPMVKHIVDAFHKTGVPNVYLVIGHKYEMVQDTLGETVKYVLQLEQNGTAHAVLQSQKIIPYQGKHLFVFVGDSPLISSDTINKLYQHHIATKAVCTFLTADFPVKLPWARVIRDQKGTLIKCVEEKNASEEEKQVTELLSSHFIFDADKLFGNLNKVQPDKDNGELYLTDMIDIFLNMQETVEVLSIKNYQELVGLNTPEEVAWAEAFANSIS